MFENDHVYSVSVLDTAPATSPDTPAETEKLLLEFLQQYRVGGEFIYRYESI
jgi:DNA replication licensing factor MCM5